MKKKGFSLIELVIAVSLASFVLLGVASIAAQMVRAQVDGMRSGTVTGWTLVSYTAMVKEIEDANVLAYPTNGTSQDQLIICKNWSRAYGGKLDSSGNVSVVQYCVDGTAPVAPETGYTLRRYENTGAAVTCPSPGVPVSCTSLTPPGTWTRKDVIGFRLEKVGGANIFTRDDAIGGVRINYIIGSPAATANQPVAKSTPVTAAITMAKAYGTTLD